MARDRGNEKGEDAGVRDARHDYGTDSLDEEDGGRGQPVLSELARRALALGLSGFFFTESTIRKALGDTLPRDWTDFAVDQSERTRKEFLERLTYEIAQSLEKVDLAAVLGELLSGRTVEVHAEIRLRKGPDSESEAPAFRTTLRGTRDDT
jgi:hypothetical protein